MKIVDDIFKIESEIVELQKEITILENAVEYVKLRHIDEFHDLISEIVEKKGQLYKRKHIVQKFWLYKRESAKRLSK